MFFFIISVHFILYLIWEISWTVFIVVLQSSTYFKLLLVFIFYKFYYYALFISLTIKFFFWMLSLFKFACNYSLLWYYTDYHLLVFYVYSFFSATYINFRSFMKVYFKNSFLNWTWIHTFNFSRWKFIDHWAKIYIKKFFLFFYFIYF